MSIDSLQNLRATMLAVAAEELGATNCDEEPTFLQSGRSTLVLKRGQIVVKSHSSETEVSELNSRLRWISKTMFRKLFVQPIRYRVEPMGGSLLTVWPAGTMTAVTTPEEFDWEGSARLIAALHSILVAETFAETKVPDAGWLVRLARSRSRLLLTNSRIEKRVVLAAFATLPPFASKAWRTNHPCFVHGDWHPGQVVDFQGSPHLIDIDDVGIGDPAWDLARPAAWRLAGLLSVEVWNRFMEPYRDARGPAFDSEDPWATLELPARAAAIQDAANALLRAERDERKLEYFEIELVNVCRRIVNQFN